MSKVYSVLADTSDKKLNITLTENGQTISSFSCSMKRNFNENILRTLDFILTTASVRAEDIENWYVITGPGSYTGIRIGIGTFLGLASGYGRQLKGISTLDAAALLSGKTRVQVSAKVRKNLFVLKSYDFENRIFSDFETVEGEGAADGTLSLDEFNKSSDGLSGCLSSPYFSEFVTGCEPLYFRKSEAEINFDKKGGCF